MVVLVLVEVAELLALDSLFVELDDSELFSELLDDSDSDEEVRPLADAEDERESVMYQPLPLKTMPTG